MAETIGPGRDPRVLAKTPPVSRWWRIWLLVQGLLATYWLWRALTVQPRNTTGLVLALALAVTVVGGVAFLVRTRERGETRIETTETELRVVRRFKPVVVARDQVLAVRGDVPGKPTWSHQVLLDTTAGPLKLPPLDRAAGVPIPELQSWAGVGERPDDPPEARESQASTAS